MREYEVDIIQTDVIGDTTYLLELECVDLAGLVVPGQFFQLRAGTGTDPFLRRTVSVSGVNRSTGTVRLLINAIGPGTEILCSHESGTKINVIGPLGNGFDMTGADVGPIWIVAGGIGAAPLFFLAQELKQSAGTEIKFFMGAQSRQDVVMIERFLPADIAREVSTDDGSEGFHGMVTDIVEKRIRDEIPAVIYTCGPKAMMRRMASIAAQAECPCQVSLEERMACGTGACYGCVVKQKKGTMARICTDGPVFDSREIVWD